MQALQCPLFPQKRTLPCAHRISALCHNRTNGTEAKNWVKRDSRLSARQQDQDKPDHGGAAAVIDPLSRVHHEALGGPMNQVRALARPEQAHCQEKETDEGKSAFINFSDTGQGP